MPGEGYEGVTEFVFDVITGRGINACPPLVVGVGVSTAVETAARLSKLAILRPLGTHHPDPNAAKLERLPALLLPRKGRHGLIDYEKAFAPDLKAGPDLFDLRGVDRERGAVVVVRPDQYVAHVLPLEARAELAAFFAAFLLDAT